MSLTLSRLGKTASKICCLMGFAILAGCNRAHFYNQAEHEWAQQAEASFKAAKLSESTKEEQKLMAKMLDRELRVVCLAATKLLADRPVWPACDWRDSTGTAKATGGVNLGWCKSLVQESRHQFGAAADQHSSVDLLDVFVHGVAAQAEV